MLLSNIQPLRSLKAVFTATAVTFFLLLFMTSLVTTDTHPNNEIICALPGNIFQPPAEIEDIYKQHKKPPPKIKSIFKPAPPTATATPNQEPIEPVKFDKNLFAKNDLHTMVTGPGIGNSLFNGSGNRPASLANPVAARYPAIAIDRNLEGYVDVIFDITPTGTTANVRVVAAEPARVFNRSAVKAVKKWKYRPQVEGGVAVAVTGVVARVHFELEK